MNVVSYAQIVFKKLICQVSLDQPMRMRSSNMTVQICVSYNIILMYYLNYEHTSLWCKQFTVTARCYSSHYLSITANEPEVSPIGLLAFKEKLDGLWSLYLTILKGKM